MKKYAVVDIETTGLVHQGHGITEIAVVHVDGDVILPVFHSMVNPGRDIPLHISQLTGIKSQLISAAPTFSEIAHKLAACLEGRIFAAHHVNFDYTFLKKALEACGIRIPTARLCTVRLAKRCMPDLPSARLGALCRKLGVENTSPHRAMGDALAAAEILCKLKALEDGRFLDEELKGTNRPTIIPAHLDAASVTALPELPGVYYFYSAASHRPIYVGKARNLKQRVISHFTSPGSSARKQLFQRELSRLNFTVTDSEYMALLLEDAEIKRHLPKYNRAQKSRALPFAVRCYETRSGQLRLGILSSGGHPDDLAFFGSAHAAKQWIIEQVRTFGFDPRRAGLAPLYADDLSLPEEAEEDENFRSFLKAADESKEGDFALLEPDRNGRRGYVLVKSGRYCGFGHMPAGDTPEPEGVERTLNRAPESSVVRAVIRNMLSDSNITKIEFQ
ncbi:MAG: exonuclease domain-containing protein [Cryomorphaceae bacterium]